tara:strand:- start:218 stop:424 length:207 start_codon:yes stop_codon:yes gene_type:complete
MYNKFKLNINERKKKMKVFKVKNFVVQAHKKPMPKDVVEFMNKERKGVKFGDMDFVHFVRAVQKDARE